MYTDVTTPPPTDAPWRRLRHLDTKNCEIRFQQICQKFGEAESAELFLDRLLELFQERRSCELVYIMNFMGSGKKELDIFMCITTVVFYSRHSIFNILLAQVFITVFFVLSLFHDVISI